MVIRGSFKTWPREFFVVDEATSPRVFWTFDKTRCLVHDPQASFERPSSLVLRDN